MTDKLVASTLLDLGDTQEESDLHGGCVEEIVEILASGLLADSWMEEDTNLKLEQRRAKKHAVPSRQVLCA